MRNLITIAALLFALAAHAQGTGPMRPDQNIPFTGQVTTPSCTLSTTTGNISVTAVPPCASASSQGIAWNLVGPLTGNATLGFPSGLLDGFSMGFIINHGTGGYTLSVASGYIFPSASISGAQPVLTNTADAVDLIVCQSATAPLPGTTTPSVLSLWCGGPPLNMTVASSVSWALASPSSHGGAGSTTGNGVTVTIPTTGANLIVVNATYSTTAPTLTDAVGACSSPCNTWSTAFTSFNTNNSQGVKQFYVISPTVGASHAFTLTGTSSFPSIEVQAWTKTGGTPALDTTATNNTAANVSTVTTGSATPAGGSELAVASLNMDNGTSPTIGSSYTISDSNANTGNNHGGAMAYLTPISTAQNPSWSWAGTETPSAGIGLYK